jgi:hypothetical protein
MSKTDKHTTSDELESENEIVTNESESETESESEVELDTCEAKLKMLKNLKYDFASYEIKYIYETYLKNELELDLSPSYQREFTWSNEKQDLFIDSVVNNYIIPPIILIKLNGKKGRRYECMDGQHRLTVLKHYIEGKPINKDSQHYIRYVKKENDKNINIYYKETDRDTSKENNRIMNINELSAFNDKKLIVIKISNFDKNMDETFDKIKNEMFLRLQKGERVNCTDMIRNHDNPLINTLRNYNLLKYKTYETNETYKRLPDILYCNTKKIPLKLKYYIYFLIRSMIIIKEDKLDVGNISDSIINDDFLKKNSNRFKFDEEKCIGYVDKFKKFISRVYKMREQEELPKFNEYFLLILLKIYLEEKDKLNDTLEIYEKIKDFNTDEYYKKLFNKNINGKTIKFISGKYLEKPYEKILEILNTNEN